jgi:hypothetical protein
MNDKICQMQEEELPLPNPQVKRESDHGYPSAPTKYGMTQQLKIA